MDVVTLALAKKYTKESLAGAGAVKGQDGVGIVDIEQTKTSTENGGENIITITMTDGTKYTFSVFNGSGSDYPIYDGSTTVKPSVKEQSLETSETLLMDNITIQQIPISDTSNSSGGTTVTIG